MVLVEGGEGKSHVLTLCGYRRYLNSKWKKLQLPSSDSNRSTKANSTFNTSGSIGSYLRSQPSYESVPFLHAL